MRFDEYGEALLARGCAVLRVNCRGHDPVCRALVFGEYKKMGAAYEDMEGCLEDWAAWIEFAQAAGYRRIGLWGHSLGATKSIYYMAVRKDPRVRRVVAVLLLGFRCVGRRTRIFAYSRPSTATHRCRPRGDATRGQPSISAAHQRRSVHAKVWAGREVRHPASLALDSNAHAHHDRHRGSTHDDGLQRLAGQGARACG